MTDLYPWVVVAHELGGFGFVFAHGVSAFVAFRLRGARRREEVATLMQLSSASLGIAYLSLLVLLVAGIAAGFIGGWWSRAWIWLSIGVLVAINVAMYAIGSPYYIQVRHAVGLGAPQDPKGTPPPVPLADDELVRLLDSPRPMILAAIGGGGLALIVALMVLKPG